MTVIPFRGPRRSHLRAPPLRPPAALDPYGRPPEQSAFDAREDRLRMRQNLGACAVVLVIVVLGGWLIDRLTTYSRTMACLEAGHHNCVPLDIEQPRRW
jgi:hypothetical protein